MATMNSDIYDAFRAAGCEEEKARKAAEAVFESQAATKGDIQELRKDFHTIDKQLVVIKWMIALVLTTTAIPFLKGLIIP